MTKIESLNGREFAQMFISGANHLYNNKRMVDELNVFPVPDGDTGTNMSLTAAAVANELTMQAPSTVTKAADIMQFAALRGARGNSGVILSQIFRGISKSLKGVEACDAAELATALKTGSEYAYKAVMKPTEGTILTVARVSAEGAVAASGTDIAERMAAALESGQAALDNTPNQLKALAEAGVVDAGGQGWICIIQGMLAYLQTGTAVAKEGADANTAAVSTAPAQAAAPTKDIKFKYCTEFLIEKSDASLSADEFRDTISPKGDCMLVIDDDDIVKVHIHTNHPGEVIEAAIKLGELINIKIDNMKHQHKSIIAEAPKPDSGKAVSVSPDPKRKPKTKPPVKETGFATVCAGKGLAHILKDLGVDIVIEGGQTMNPSTDDILKAARKVRAKTVFVFPNNKNIIMAANQAAQLYTEGKLIVIPSTNTPQCISAMMAYNQNRSAEENEKLMTKALKKVAVGQITFAVRDTEIDGVKIHKNDIIGIEDGEITVVGEDINDVLEELVKQMSDEDTEYITVYTGKDVKKAQAEDAAQRLSAYEEDEIEVSFQKGAQPLYYYIVSVE